ncbi:hypothetical protein BGW38_000906 [Lunasporangiospora selenospora]|uniref:RRM domain-containing protein n=1 Tax=Lunasporangiospora selenospora TaxID=979761 RepID=A0A9P6FUL5_9FUNG|nr:hypothetical protein BGW38_000906 [Lunasporangiospora selenospora]
MIAIKGSAPVQETPNMHDNDLATIQIENLDPGTTSEDVKYVCNRFGEIRSCICMGGYAEVTYARRAAGQAAVDKLNGKVADNANNMAATLEHVLRVKLRKTPILHNTLTTSASQMPRPLSDTMKHVIREVQGTIVKQGSVYNGHLAAAQELLKVQEQRMAELHQRELAIAELRAQGGTPFGDMSLYSSTK